MNLADAKAYLKTHGLSPESIKERHCSCRRCVEARQAELLETVRRAIAPFRIPRIIPIKKGRNT